MSGNGDMDLTGDDFRAILSQFLKRRDLNIVEELLIHVTRKTRLARDAGDQDAGRKPELPRARERRVRRTLRRLGTRREGELESGFVPRPPTPPARTSRGSRYDRQCALTPTSS